MLQHSISRKYGFQIWWDEDDSFVGRTVADDNYEPYESDLFLSLLKPDSIILDVGANIGYYSLLAAKVVDVDVGKIYAIEPERRNYELLQKNIESSSYSSIVPFKLAIGKEDGNAELFLSTTNKGDHQLYFSSGREMQVVDAVTLDSFIKQEGIRPTVIKIDTQGYDYLVLKGGLEYINNTPGLLVFTEFWDHGNRNANVDSRQYFDFLQQTFSQVLYIDEDKQDVYPVDFEFLAPVFAKHSNHGHGNFLCIK